MSNFIEELYYGNIRNAVYEFIKGVKYVSKKYYI